jgi:hypothetical protein
MTLKWNSTGFEQVTFKRKSTGVEQVTLNSTGVVHSTACPRLSAFILVKIFRKKLGFAFLRLQ